MDWVRAFYFIFMTKTGLADTYRNEQYFPKADFFYNLERNLLAANFGNPNREKISLNIIILLRYQINSILEYLEEDSEEEDDKE